MNTLELEKIVLIATFVLVSIAVFIARANFPRTCVFFLYRDVNQRSAELWFHFIHINKHISAILQLPA